MSRESFQQNLAALNPAWATFLDQLLANGALTTEDPSIRRQKGLRTNPDGDVDLPDAPYSTFRYPACPTCVANPPMLPSGERGKVEMDTDGAYRATSTCGILKPAVVMFGEAIPPTTKAGADAAILGADKILVVGSSLATYSAFRLVKRARELGMSIGILNLGGVRGEEVFFGDVEEGETRRGALRCSMDAQEVLPDVVQAVEKSMGKAS
jgi:NAD-dependent SIR2 family protein deacetylase